MNIGFKNWLLSETPISSFGLLGDWGPESKKYGYKKDDIGILTSPTGVEKIKQKWAKTRQDFDLYFVKSKEGYLISRSSGNVGEVDEKYLKEKLKINIPIDHEHITVVYLSNVGTDRMPMNYWTIAHRFGHAVSSKPLFGNFAGKVDRFFNNAMNIIYGETKPYRFYTIDDDFERKQRKYETNLKSLIQAVGTTGSARKKQLVRIGEFYLELLAQYIITGEIKLNPFPKNVVTHYYFGNPIRGLHANNELEKMNTQLEFYVNDWNAACYEILESSLGKIFVMI